MNNSESGNDSAVSRPAPSSWLKRNHSHLQVLALAVALIAPFALYWALESEQNGPAVVFFMVIVASLAYVALAS